MRTPGKRGRQNGGAESREDVAVRTHHRSAVLSLLFLICLVACADGQEPTKPSTVDLIRQLGSERFREREAAHQALLARNEALPELRRLLPTLNAEGRRRANAIVEEMFHRRTKQILKYARDGRVDLLVEWSALAGKQIDPEEFWQCVLDIAWERLRNAQTKEGVDEFAKHFPSRTYTQLLEKRPMFLDNPETLAMVPIATRVVVRSS